jgi:hypothetical protein
MALSGSDDCPLTPDPASRRMIARRNRRITTPRAVAIRALGWRLRVGVRLIFWLRPRQSAGYALGFEGTVAATEGGCEASRTESSRSDAALTDQKPQSTAYRLLRHGMHRLVVLVVRAIIIIVIVVIFSPRRTNCILTSKFFLDPASSS